MSDRRFVRLPHHPHSLPGGLLAVSPPLQDDGHLRPRRLASAPGHLAGVLSRGGGAATAGEDTHRESAPAGPRVATRLSRSRSAMEWGGAGCRRWPSEIHYSYSIILIICVRRPPAAAVANLCPRLAKQGARRLLRGLHRDAVHLLPRPRPRPPPSALLSCIAACSSNRCGPAQLSSQVASGGVCSGGTAGWQTRNAGTGRTRLEPSSRRAGAPARRPSEDHGWVGFSGWQHRQDHVVELNFPAVLGRPARRELLHHHRPAYLPQEHAHPALPPPRGHAHTCACRGRHVGAVGVNLSNTP